MKSLRGFAISVLAAVCVLAAGACKQPTEEAKLLSKRGEPSALSHEGTAVWTRLVESWTPLQRFKEACRPLRMRPQAGEVSGIAVLLHDFLACPGQMKPLGALLAANGFDVLIPVLPGHGLQSEVGWQNLADDRDFMERYGGLGHHVSGLLRDAKGRRVVAGLGLGGAIAAFALTNPSQPPDATLLLAPTFESSPAWASFVLGEYLNTPQVFEPSEEMRTTPRKIAGCQASEPRYCQFAVHHALAVNQFGYAVFEDRLRSANGNTLVQVIGFAGDPLRNHAHWAEAAEKLGGGCSIEGQPLSPTDALASPLSGLNPALDERLFALGAKFLGESLPFVLRDGKTDGNLPICDL